MVHPTGRQVVDDHPAWEATARVKNNGKTVWRNIGGILGGIGGGMCMHTRPVVYRIHARYKHVSGDIVNGLTDWWVGWVRLVDMV